MPPADDRPDDSQISEWACQIVVHYGGNAPAYCDHQIASFIAKRAIPEVQTWHAIAEQVSAMISTGAAPTPSIH